MRCVITPHSEAVPWYCIKHNQHETMTDEHSHIYALCDVMIDYHFNALFSMQNNELKASACVLLCIVNCATGDYL